MAYFPHVGETVLVYHKDCHSNGAQVVPAIVQQTWPGSRHINLIAFPPFKAPQQLGSVEWFDSTPMIADENFVGCWPRNTHHAHVGEVDNSGDRA